MTLCRILLMRWGWYIYIYIYIYTRYRKVNRLTKISHGMCLNDLYFAIYSPLRSTHFIHRSRCAWITLVKEAISSIYYIITYAFRITLVYIYIYIYISIYHATYSYYNSENRTSISVDTPVFKTYTVVNSDLDALVKYPRGKIRIHLLWPNSQSGRKVIKVAQQIFFHSFEMLLLAFSHLCKDSMLFSRRHLTSSI